MPRRKFRPKDWAQIKYGEFAGRCCRVSMLEKGGGYVVIPYDEHGEPGSMITLDARALDKIPPLIFTGEELRDLICAKTMYHDYDDRVYPAFNIAAGEDHVLTAADIRDALVRINARPEPLAAFKEWFWIILNVFYDNLHIAERYDEEAFSDMPQDEDEMFSIAYGMTERLYWRMEERFGQKEDLERFIIKFAEDIDWKSEKRRQVEETGYRAVTEDIISRVNVFEFNQSRPGSRPVYSSSEKKHIISGYEGPESLGEATPEAIEMFREFVEDLYLEGDILALKNLAWGYFDGNAAFVQDWPLAEKYMSEFFRRTGDPYAANALGYMSYYGLAGNGAPKYEDAFRYFSLGALAGVDESCYRTSDMLIAGRGTAKNIDLGLNLILEGYKEAMAGFCAGHHDNRLAEYALRMGNACRNDLIYGMNLRDAYKFYLEGEFALKTRKKTVNYRGDVSTQLKLALEIRRIKEKFDLFNTKHEVRTDFPLFMNQLFEDRHPLKVYLKVAEGAKEGTLRVARYRKADHKLRSMGFIEEGSEMEKFFQIPPILAAFPELSRAELITGLTYKLENVVVARKVSKGPFFWASGFRKNESTNGLEFFCDGKMVAAIDAEWYVVDLDTEKREEENDKNVK